MRNINLVSAKVNKNDEFYTRYEDIAEEMSYYSYSQFHGKTVYCNCDDPNKSMFFSFFQDNMKLLGIEKAIATNHVERVEKKVNLLSSSKDRSTEREALIGVTDESGTTIESLRGDGDFMSDECMDILESADIICTNPPFSLFKEFFDAISKSKKKFLVVGPLNAVTYRNVWDGISSGETRIGFTYPTKFEVEDGKSRTFGNICWYTNLESLWVKPKIKIDKVYDEKNYRRYCNFDGIDVENIEDIPSDYDGCMGVPLTAIKYDLSDFDIVGNSHVAGSVKSIEPLGKTWTREYAIQGNTGHYSPSMRVLALENPHKVVFGRIVIRRKR